MPLLLWKLFGNIKHMSKSSLTGDRGDRAAHIDLVYFTQGCLKVVVICFGWFFWWLGWGSEGGRGRPRNPILLRSSLS